MLAGEEEGDGAARATGSSGSGNNSHARVARPPEGADAIESPGPVLDGALHPPGRLLVDAVRTRPRHTGERPGGAAALLRPMHRCGPGLDLRCGGSLRHGRREQQRDREHDVEYTHRSLGKALLFFWLACTRRGCTHRRCMPNRSTTVEVPTGPLRAEDGTWVLEPIQDVCRQALEAHGVDSSTSTPLSSRTVSSSR